MDPIGWQNGRSHEGLGHNSGRKQKIEPDTLSQSDMTQIPLENQAMPSSRESRFRLLADLPLEIAFKSVTYRLAIARVAPPLRRSRAPALLRRLSGLLLARASRKSPGLRSIPRQEHSHLSWHGKNWRRRF
jgi:hypothetical protein